MEGALVRSDDRGRKKAAYTCSFYIRTFQISLERLEKRGEGEKRKKEKKNGRMETSTSDGMLCCDHITNDHVH